VEVNLDKGQAAICLSDIVVGDFGTNNNSFQRGASVPATVALDVRWQATGKPVPLRAVNQFRGEFLHASATIAWSAQRSDFQFVSDSAETSTTVFAAIGRERNGVFF
jgi:hypothetical protein